MTQINSASNEEGSRGLATCSLRRACLTDVQQLVVLSRICFPQTWPWYAPMWYLLPLWTAILRSKAAETYLALLENRPVGFAVLVVNEPLWNAERKFRHGSYVRRACAVSQRPLHGLRLALKRLRLAMSARLSTSQAPELSRLCDDRVFLGTLGVMPDLRRHGIARALMELRENRAKELCRSLAWGMTDIGNTPAERFLTTYGYRCVRNSRLGTTWERILT